MAHTPFAYLSTQYGWRHAMYIDAGVGALIFVWLFFIVKDNPNADHTSVSSSYFSGFLEVLTNRQNWLAGIYTACLNLPIMVLCALWGASYLAVAHQLDGMAASNIVSLIFMGSIFGCPLVGWLSDRLGRRKPLMLMGAIATLIIISPLLMGVSLSPVVLSVLFFALGVFTSTQVIAYPLIAESNAPAQTGVATGMASVIIMGGGGFGQVLFGVLMRHHAQGLSQQYAVGDFQFAMWMFPIAALVALLAILLTRETHCRRLKRSGDAGD